MMYQSWWTSIWSLCLNQQSISFTIQTQPVWTRITAIHTHCQENSLEKLCKATVYRGHRRECGLLGNTFHIHISQIGHISFSKIKKEKKLFMEITIKGVSCSIYRVICSYFPFFISLHFIHLCHPDTSYSHQENDGGGTWSI